MNQYLTGTVIKELREQQNLTQLQFAELIHVSDKAVSKWETGRGYPDIAILEDIASVFHISVAELLSGETANNYNRSANMLKSRFYVCPVCGNILNGVGDAFVSCHGIRLLPEEIAEEDESHRIELEITEDEYFVTVNHPMTKEHYISFLAAVSTDKIQIQKLYPEGNAQTRFKINGVKKVYMYCNRDGMFGKTVINKRRK